jgi:hypothetical protein
MDARERYDTDESMARYAYYCAAQIFENQNKNRR